MIYQQRYNFYIFAFTLLFNTAIAILLWYLLNNNFWVDFVISNSIGLSIMVSNFLIIRSKHTHSFIRITIYSLIGLMVGSFIGFSSVQIIFGIKTISFIPVALFFGIIGTALVWLALKRIESKETLNLIKRKLNKNLTKNLKYLHWIKSSDAKGVIYLINVNDVLYFQSEQKYTTVVTIDKGYIISTTIKDLIKQLNPNTFWQVHRSTIVNLNFIEKVSKNEVDKLTVFLTNSAQLNISRSFLYLFKRT